MMPLRESLRNRRFMRRLGVLWMMFFTACISSYANDLNSSSLSGNLFVNQIMFGVLITFSKMVRPTIYLAPLRAVMSTGVNKGVLLGTA